MAFAIRNLSVLAYVKGFTLWHYKAGNDDMETVTAPYYFTDASDMVSVGDVMLISTKAGARQVSVSRSEPEGVDIAPMI